MLKTRYGITPEQYTILLTMQRGVCAICQKPPFRVRLAIDHDHKTGKIRGLLCRRCNCGIGNARESTAILAMMIAYLMEHGCT